MRSTFAVTEKVLGSLFVLAAVLKIFDLEAFAVQITYYHVLKDPPSVWAAAIGVVAWEMLLGVAMLLGLRLRGWTFAAVIGTLLGLSGLILYAWAYHDLKDCGCFGSYIPMGPVATISKNLIFVVMAGFGWWGLRGDKNAVAHTKQKLRRVKVIAAFLSFAVVLLICIFQTTSAEPASEGDVGSSATFAFDLDIEQTHFDLTEGEYIVAFMSDTCEDCRGALPKVNDWALIPEFPPVVGLLLSDGEETLKEFREAAEFPVTGIEVIKWFSFIADAPPSYYLIRDGEQVARWDHEAPSLEELLALLIPAETEIQ
jgi:hypothetical protein